MRKVSRDFQGSLGVEAGSYALSLVLLESAGSGKVRLREAKRVPVDPDQRWGSPEYARHLSDSIESLPAYRKGRTEVWATLTNDQVKLFHLEMPQSAGDGLNEAIYWAVQKEEAFDEKEMLLDFEVDPPLSESALMPVTAYLVPRQVISETRQVFESSGIHLKGILLPLNAMENLLRYKGMGAGEEPEAFAHIGEKMSRISVRQNGQIVLTRGIPIGLDHVMEAALESSGRDVSVQSLERSLQEDPEGTHLRLEGATGRMARQIERTTEYFQNSTRQFGSISRVLLGGELAAVPGISGPLGGQLLFPLEVPDPFSDMETGSAPTEPGGGYISATGAALAALGHGQNFLETWADRQKSVKLERINRWFFWVFIVTVAIGGVLFAGQFRQERQLRDQLSRLEADISGEVGEVTTANLMQKVTELDRLREEVSWQVKRKEALALVTELNVRTPRRIGIDRVTGNLTSGQSEGESSRTFRISGVVTGNPRDQQAVLALYARELGESLLFDEVEIAGSRRSSDTSGALEFELHCELAGRNGGGE